jgi:hypothetical protein
VPKCGRTGQPRPVLLSAFAGGWDQADSARGKSPTDAAGHPQLHPRCCHVHWGVRAWFWRGICDALGLVRCDRGREGPFAPKFHAGCLSSRVSQWDAARSGRKRREAEGSGRKPRFMLSRQPRQCLGHSPVAVCRAPKRPNVLPGELRQVERRSQAPVGSRPLRVHWLLGMLPFAGPGSSLRSSWVSTGRASPIGRAGAVRQLPPTVPPGRCRVSIDRSSRAPWPCRVPHGPIGSTCFWR